MTWINRHLMTILLMLVSVAAGVLGYQEDLEKQGCTVKSVGTVVSVHRERVNRNRMGKKRLVTVYVPTITYEADGRTITGEAYGLENPVFEVGQELDIFYNPDKPERFIQPNMKAYYTPHTGKALAINLLLIALVIAAMTAVGVLLDRSRAKRAALRNAQADLDEGKRGFTPRTLFYPASHAFGTAIVLFLFVMLYIAYGTDLTDSQLGGCFLVGFALLAMSLTACFIRQECGPRGTCTVRTSGQVVDFTREEEPGGPGKPPLYQYRPVIEYTADGVRRREPSTQTQGYQGQMGVPVKLWYDPEHPGTFRLIPEMGLFKGVFAVVFLLEFGALVVGFLKVMQIIGKA